MLIENTGARLLFIAAATLGQLFIIRDLITLMLTAWQPAFTETMQEAMPQVIRQIGRRNSIHFAILGLTIAIGSAVGDELACNPATQ